jgi:heme-degrading monooxygenase HmoA
MQALFFEVLPKEGHEGPYLDHAAALRPELDKNPGLMFIDRFRSVAQPALILSHSLWKDEASLANWRTNAKHHVAQVAGRNVHFADYRLRIAQVIALTTRDQPLQSWTEQNPYNAPQLVDQRYCVVVEANGKPFDEPGETFASLNRDGAFVSIHAAQSKTQGDELLAAATACEHVEGAKLCLVSRDYGMHERGEAPQYFPPAK